MRQELALFVMLSALAPSLAQAAPGNPIVGEWKLVKPGCNSMTRIVYTPTEYAGFEIPTAPFPGWTRHSVTYVVSKEEVWLRNGAMGNDVRVFPIDADHIKPDDGT